MLFKNSKASIERHDTHINELTGLAAFRQHVGTSLQGLTAAIATEKGYNCPEDPFMRADINIVTLKATNISPRSDLTGNPHKIKCQWCNFRPFLLIVLGNGIRSRYDQCTRGAHP